MHADEVDTDAGLVRRLLAAQFPQWAELPVERVRSDGTDNALYRLGDDLVARLPRSPSRVHLVAKEVEWLPRLAPHLPVAVPIPLAEGAPGEGYPWPWSVCTWLAGENPTVGALDDPASLAVELAAFVGALQLIDPTDGPPAGEGNFQRGVPLAERDARTREAIEALRGVVDTEAVTAAWEMALSAPPWSGAPVWLHGDLAPGNVLLVDGRLSAVIDFGCLGVGDPAVDLIVAWNLLPPRARDLFRAALEVDAAAWERGRGWALSFALIALPYYERTNPALVASSRHVLRELLAA